MQEQEIQESGVRSQESEPTPKSLLDLKASERVVMLRDQAGRDLKHVFAPLTAEDWLEYERTVKPTISFLAEEEIETRSSLRQAAAQLWEKRIRRLAGYDSEVQGSAFNVQKVPLTHRVEAVKGLDQVEWDAEAEAPVDSETTSVVLKAWWNGEFFPRLVHQFNRPLIEHEIRLQEAGERRVVITSRIGGQKRLKPQRLESRSVPILPTLIALYDELIVGVEGYRAGIQDSGFRIQEMMDTPHKSAAVRALFAGSPVALATEQ